jgi:hypothetical protein
LPTRVPRVFVVEPLEDQVPATTRPANREP